MEKHDYEIRMIEWRIMKTILLGGEYEFIQGAIWYGIKFNFDEKNFELYRLNRAFNKKVKIYSGNIRLIAAQIYLKMPTFNRVDVDAVEKLSELPSDIYLLPKIHLSKGD